MAEQYTSLHGNKFDKGLSKLLKDWRSRPEGSSSPPNYGTISNEESQSPVTNSNRREVVRKMGGLPEKKYRRNRNEKQSQCKSSKDQYSNYLKEIPKGL